MALNYPGFVVPQRTTTTLLDVLDSWNKGEAAGKDERFQREAPDVFAQSAAPLSQFGLDTPPDQLKAMFANPETRPMALQMVQEATQRRDDAKDPLKQLQLRKAQLDLQQASQPAAPADPFANAPAAIREYVQYRNFEKEAGREPVDFLTFKNGAPDAAPSGYQLTPDGQMTFIPGGPADPSNPLNAKRSGGGTPSPTIAKEIFEADEAVQAGEAVVPALQRAIELNKTAWDGPLADIGTQAGALFGDTNSVNTQEMKNLVTAQALDQLKAVFGGMPTEGERKILLDIQGSVNQSREVRDRIFRRAEAAANRRNEFNRQKAAGLRSGEYFDEGFGTAVPAAPAAGDDIDGILSGLGI